MGEGILVFRNLTFLQRPNISFDFEVGPISGAVRELSKVSGVPLSVEGVARNETVFLHVDNRPLQEVLDEIAKVTTSEWTSNGSGGFKLSRPASLIERARTAENQQLLSIVKAWQSDGIKPIRGPSAMELESKYVAALRRLIKNRKGYRGTYPSKYVDEGLLAPLYQECLKRIDPAKIAKLQLDQRVVFSSSPTPRQASFTQSRTLAIRDLNDTLKRWRTSLAKAGLRTKALTVDPKKYEQSILTDGGANATLPFARPVASVVLSFNATSYDSALAVMSLLDDRGQVVAAMLCDQVRLSLPKRQPVINLPEIESANLVSTSRQTRALFDASEQHRHKKPGHLSDQEISEALAPYFNDPENNDFLKLGNQEFLSFLGPATKRSIVACIPDGQFLHWDETRVKRFVEAGIGDATTSAVSENWIEFFPRNPASHWQSQGNREALARCAKAWSATQTMPMRDVVHLFPGGSIGYPNILEFAQLAMPPARNLHYNSQVAYTNYRGMGELLGSLTDAQMKLLLHGTMIRYRDLSKAQRSYCEAIVYGVPFHRIIGGTGAWEPTIELPNGLNDNLGITAQYIDEKYLLAHDPEEPPYDDIRETMALDEQPERFNGAQRDCGNYARANRWMKFDFRTRRRFALRCYLTKGHYYSVDYYDPISPDKGQRLTVDQLSPSLVAKIKKANGAFNSRVVVTIDKNGDRHGRTETYQEPKKKK